MPSLFTPGQIPKNIPSWQYEAFRALGNAARSHSVGLAAIIRGESPDGSGSSLLDLSKYFYLPGRVGGQIAYGSTNPAGTLILSSTINTIKGKIYLGSGLLNAFDESFGFLGLGTASPTACLHILGNTIAQFVPSSFTIVCTLDSTTTVTTTNNFYPSGGPSVVPGMLVTGSGIPANTYVQTITSGTQLTLTNAASITDTSTLTFQTSTTIQNSQETETGKDLEYTVRGAIRFTPGTANIPLRIVGDRSAIAAGIAVSDRVYLETGVVINGSAIGTELQLGGPRGGELAHMNISTRTLWIGRNPVIGTNTCVGIGINPATYGGGFGPNANLLVSTIKDSNIGILIMATAQGGATDAFAIYGGFNGTSPDLTIDTATLTFKVTQDGKVYIGNNAGSSCYLTASDGQFIVNSTSSSKQYIALGNEAAWSDTLIAANSFAHRLGDLVGSDRAVYVCSSGNGIFTRLGFSSQYTLITNAQVSKSAFLAPEATIPTVLHIINSSSEGFDGSVILKVRSQRTEQTGDLAQFIGSSGTPFSGVTAAGKYYLTSGAGVGKVLTSDASGVGSWSSVAVKGNVCEVLCNMEGSEVYTETDFTKIAFHSLDGYTLTDPGSNYSAANDYYVVPVAGLYMIVTKMRIGDEADPDKSYGQGAHTSVGDSPYFMWFSTNASGRQGSLNTRISHFNVGDHIQMLYYSDEALMWYNAYMSIVPLFVD